MLYETRFLLALGTTWAIEIPVLYVIIRVGFRNKTLPRARIAGTGLLCTALTLPYLWFVLPPYVDAAYYPVIGEALAVLIEAAILNRLLGLDVKQSVAGSLAMNAVSFFLGAYLL